MAESVILMNGLTAETRNEVVRTAKDAGFDATVAQSGAVVVSLSAATTIGLQQKQLELADTLVKVVDLPPATVVHNLLPSTTGAGGWSVTDWIDLIHSRTSPAGSANDNGVPSAPGVPAPSPGRPTPGPPGTGSSTSSTLQADLWHQLDPETRKELAEELVRVRNGLLTVGVQKALDERSQVEIERARETVEHLKKWRTLAETVPRLLSWTLLFSVVMSLLSYWALIQERMNGVEFIGALFVLAIIAISPAALLLMERPLRGIDSFTPSGTTPPSE